VNDFAARPLAGDSQRCGSFLTGTENKRGYKLRQAAPENWSGFFVGNAGG